MNFSIQNDPWAATMKPDGTFGWQALIKLEKTREESKSSAAGERKELMLKSRSL